MKVQLIKILNTFTIRETGLSVASLIIVLVLSTQEDWVSVLVSASVLLQE